jgi:uncharacterized membrane protein
MGEIMTFLVKWASLCDVEKSNRHTTTQKIYIIRILSPNIIACSLYINSGSALSEPVNSNAYLSLFTQDFVGFVLTSSHTVWRTKDNGRSWLRHISLLDEFKARSKFSRDKSTGELLFGVQRMFSSRNQNIVRSRPSPNSILKLCDVYSMCCGMQ